MSISTGAAPQRGIRSSQLLFCFHARRLSLVADTGQVGRFEVPTLGNLHLTSGRNGVSATAGHGQPRFEQFTGTPTTRLSVRGDVPGYDIEKIEWDWPRKVMAMSLYAKVVPQYAVGESLTPDRRYLAIGDGTTAGGNLALLRSGTSWAATRGRAAVTIASSFVEPVGLVFPLELLVTLATGGILTLFSRDGAATPVLRNGAPITDANMLIATEGWANSVLYLGGINSSGSFRTETLKVARGIHTFDSITRLS